MNSRELKMCLHKNLIIAALFTIAKRWKQAIKVWYIHAVEYSLAVERNETLTHDTMWVNLENTLSEKANHKRPHIIRFCR